MQELSQKFEGVETVDPPSLSRRVRREFPEELVFFVFFVWSWCILTSQVEVFVFHQANA